MSNLTVNSQVVSLLSPLKEITEIRDGQGKVLGFFTPTSEQERLKSLFDLEVAERISQTEGHLGRPLEAIWQDLHAQESAK